MGVWYRVRPHTINELEYYTENEFIVILHNIKLSDTENEVLNLDVILEELGYTKHIKAATRIQRAWRRCISDPEFVICRTRLLREFESMTV